MRTTICRTIVIVLRIAFAVTVALPMQLLADCQECDTQANCFSEPASDWCQCSSKILGGEQICLVKDPGCQSPVGCGGAATLGPVRLRPIDSLAFAGFEEREPLLAGLLTVATREDAAGHRFLAAAPIVKGTMAGVHGSYRYHGAFFPRPDDRVGFLFDLDGPDRSNIVYSGVIASGGLQIFYTRTSRTSLDARPESERAEWSAPQ
jgi:hypothetical protein